MLNIDRRALFQSRLSGKNVDLGVLAPDPKDYQAIIAEMVDIGMLVPQEALEGAYKVNVNFQYDALTPEKQVIELDYEIGNIIGLNKSGNFVFEDWAGDLFVAEANAQSEADKTEEEEKAQR